LKTRKRPEGSQPSGRFASLGAARQLGGVFEIRDRRDLQPFRHGGIDVDQVYEIFQFGMEAQYRRAC